MLKPFISLYVILWSTISAANSAVNPSINVCYETKNYSPYIYSSSYQLTKGLLYDIISDAGTLAHIDIVFTQAPWLRCQKLLKENKVQATFSMIRTKAREQVFAFPNDNILDQASQRYLWLARYKVFNNKHLPFNVNSYQPYYGLGAPLGYVVTEKLRNKGWLSPLQYGVEEGLRMVAEKKLDGYVVEELIGKDMIQQLALDDVIMVNDWVVFEAQWHIVFNQDFYRKQTLLVEKFWTALNQARQHYETKFIDHSAD